MTAVSEKLCCDPCANWECTFEAVKNFAITAFKIAASIALCIYSPYAFLAGLCLGAIFAKELSGRIDSIIDLWNKNCIMKIGMVALAVLTLPMTLELAVVWTAARWSVHFLG